MAEFEWNVAKAEANRQSHGVSFEDGTRAFGDPFAVEVIDDRLDYGEERINLIGMCDSGQPASASFRPGGRSDMSRTTIIARTRADGTLVDVSADGGERPSAREPMRSLSPTEISAAAAADPDARPMTPDELAAARRVPRVKTMRRALGLTQDEFASRYHIPLGTLRDWEQGRTEPDQPARAYLRVIGRDPEGVRKALEARP